MKLQENQQWFLGSVEFDVTEKLFTRLRPVARSGVNGACWTQSDSELRESFPMQGLAYWFNAPAGTRKHQLFEFQATTNSGFDGVRRLDKLLVIHPCPAIEVIETPYYDEERLREALRSDGVALQRSPVGRTIFQLPNGCLFGPFDLVARPSNCWALPTEIKLDAIPWFESSPLPVGKVSIDGAERTILLSQGVLPAAHQFRNWLPDAEVLRSMIKRLHKLDSTAFSAVGLTYKALDTFVIAAANASLLPDQRMRENALVERVKQLRHDLPLSMDLVDEIVNALAGLGAVKRRIDERLAELGQERKTELDESLKTETQQLEFVRNKIAIAQQEHATLNKDLAAKRKAAERDLSVTDSAVKEKLSQLRAAPARTVAELLASSSIFSALLQSPFSPSVSSAKQVFFPPAQGAMLESASAAAKTLVAGLMWEGVDPTAAVPLLAAFAAGMVPVVGGEAASEALRAAGNCLCAGRVWSVPISPATVALGDLLAPSSSALAGLREILDAAHAHPDDLLMAVMEGVDLGASDGYLPTLLALPSSNSLLSLHERGACGWPDNLLLAATVSNSRQALPLPRQTWASAPLFVFSWLGTDSSLSQAAPNPTQLASSTWRTLREASSSFQYVSAHDNGLPPVRRLASRLHSCIRAVQPSAESELPVLTHLLAPACASSGRDPGPNHPPQVRVHFELAKMLISGNQNS